MAKIRKNKLKNQKQIELEKLHAFKEKIRSIFEALEAPEAFNLIPHDDLLFIYDHRIQSIKVENPNNHKLEPGIMKRANNVVTVFSKNHKIALIDGGIEIPHYDLLTVGMGLARYILTIDVCSNPNFAKLQNIAKPLLELMFEEKELSRISLFIGQSIGDLLTIIERHYYWCTYVPFHHRGCDRPPYHEKYILHRLPPMVMTVKLDGNNRTVFRIGEPQVINGVKWLKLKQEDLGIKSHIKGLKYEVCLQTHTVERMVERLDKIDFMMDYCIIESLKHLKTCKSSDDKILIEYRIDGKKVGYFVADTHGNLVVLRTFLFITNNGTPEGQRLNKSLGLDKTDKQYLAIDKLSTFLNSDIQNNEKIKAIFIKAGCGDLFELPDYMNDKNTEGRSSDTMLRYLGLN